MIVIKTKSVSEVAKELNISRQAVHQKIKHLPSHLTPKKVNGAYQLTPEIVDFIKINTNSSTNNNQTDNQEIDKQLDALERLIEQQKETIDILKSQLEEKDKQISNLQTTNIHQQQLTLNAQSRLKEIESKDKEEVVQEEEIIVEQQREKKWWRFFSK